jgi:SAM-dependent methyltransferase
MQKTLLYKIKEILKKYPFFASRGKAIRRLLNPVRFYLLRSTPDPLSNYHGFDRGTPIDRYYIEDFLNKNKSYIKGACLEVLNNDYTLTFGDTRVTSSDILDINPENKKATIITDLRAMPEVRDESYDCIILTQVLQFIDSPTTALEELHRILKPGGYILATMPSVSRIDCTSGIQGDFWRFTEASAAILFKNYSEVEITSRGNCRSGIYFLAGAALEEVSKKNLSIDDRQFPLIITVRARKK